MHQDSQVEKLLYDLNASRQPGREIDAKQMEEDVQNDFDQVMKLQSTAKVSKRRMKALIGEIVKGISDSFEMQISDLNTRSSAESRKKAPLIAMRDRALSKCNETKSSLAQTQSKLGSVVAAYSKVLEEISNVLKGKMSAGDTQSAVIDEQTKKLKAKKAKLTIKQDILNAELEEFELRVTECTSEVAGINEDITDIEEDVKMLHEKLFGVQQKFDATMVNIKKRITNEVTNSGAPGPVVMSLDDAAKIRTLGAMELQARRNYFSEVDAIKSAAHLIKNVKHESVVASSAMSLLSRRNASMQIRKIASSISPLTEEIDSISDVTRRVEDEAVRFGKESHLELSKMDSIKTIKTAVESRIHAGETFKEAWDNKIAAGKRLNANKFHAEKMFQEYSSLSEEYKTLLRRSRDALFIADRATHYSIESDVAVARAKQHVRDTKVRQKIAAATCQKLSASKLSHFETWLTNGEHGDEEADVIAVKAVQEARVATDEANEAEVNLHKAGADFERTSIEVKELEKVLADATRRADMDCKKANEDDQALEQQKQVSDADSFLAGLEASKVAAERESRLSRRRCLESRKEETKLTKQLKAATAKLQEIETSHNYATETSALKKNIAAEKMKAAMSKSKYAHLMVYQQTAAFAIAKHTACNNSKLLLQHETDAEAAVANLIKTSNRLHSRALKTRDSANALFEQTEKKRTEVAKLKESSRAAYDLVLDTYNAWRRAVREAIISKDTLFKSRRSEMDVLKKAPLRVRENLSKAYGIEKKRVDEFVKKLRDHSDVQVKYGLKAKALKDKALSKDAAALKVRRGIRKMEEESEKKAGLMMKKMMEGAQELSGSVVKVEASEEIDMTGATGSTGHTGSSSTGVTGATGMDEKTPAEDAMRKELVSAAEDAKRSATGIESEIAMEVVEGKKTGLRKSPLAHWLGPNALTDAHGCVTAAGDAFCRGTGTCFSVSEPDQCPTALNEATSVVEIKLPKCPWCVSGVNASRTAAGRLFLFPSELKVATKSTDTLVLSWSARMSKIQARNEVVYDKANKTFNQLASAAAVSNEMYSSDNAHAHLQNLLKRLELQHFNATGAVKDIVTRRVKAAKRASNLREEQHAEEGDASATGTSTGSTGATGSRGVADEHAKYADFKVAKAQLAEEASEAAAKYRDVESSDPEAHKKLLAVQEVVRSATSLKMVEAARGHLKAVIEIFEAGAEAGITGATGGDEEDSDESDSGPTGATGSSQLSAQKAEIESLKQQHALNENEWADAREVMKNKLAAAEKELHEVTRKSKNAKAGIDVTDEEVEEAIEGNSVLLHHVMPGNESTKSSGATGVAGNMTCKPLRKVDSTKPDSKCKMFTVSGEMCAGDLDYPAAEKICKSHGAHVCAHIELVDAFQAGYQSKTFGWTATKIKGENAGLLVENIMQSDEGDMKRGINVKEVERNANKKAYGVHCCGATFA